jgi:hypothetical protein
MPEQNMSEEDLPKVFMGKPGEAVPTVDSSDLKALWNCYQELGAQHPEGSVGIAIGALQRICSPGADVRAVAYRYGMLRVLAGMLEASWPGGQPSDAVFKVAARMELKWMAVGVVQNGLPFDVEKFLTEIHAESMYGGGMSEQLG